MVCHKCSSQGEFKQFTSFSYYYCKTCKIEITAQPTSSNDFNKRVDDREQRLFDTGWVKVRIFNKDFWQRKGGNGFPNFSLDEAESIQDLLDKGQSWETAIDQVINQQFAFPWGMIP